MAENLIQEVLAKVVTAARAAQEELSCLVTHLNSKQATELAQKFINVLPGPEETKEGICQIHLIHAATIILLDSLHRAHDRTRPEWLDDYASLVVCLNDEVQREAHMKEKKEVERQEAHSADEEPATTEAN